MENKNKLDFRNYDNILIYTMGRVGSMTLIRSIKRAIYNHKIQECQVHHIHKLENYTPNNNHEKPKKKTLIITAVRNFQTQLISHFMLRLASSKSIFYFIDKHKLNYQKLEARIPELSEHFTKKVPIFLEEKGNNWYDRFKDEFNIDVYSREFDFQKKYMVFETPETDLTLIRFEEIKQWDTILSDIFEQNIVIYEHKLTKDKPYASLSRKFKEEYRYPKELTDIINQSKVTKHFYQE